MAVPVPSISCYVLNHHNLFYQIQNALAFNRDTCGHLQLFLRLLPFHLLLHCLVRYCSLIISKKCQCQCFFLPWFLGQFDIKWDLSYLLSHCLKSQGRFTKGGECASDRSKRCTFLAWQLVRTPMTIGKAIPALVHWQTWQ
jgi:hypothetical protein